VRATLWSTHGRVVISGVIGPCAGLVNGSYRRVDSTIHVGLSEPMTEEPMYSRMASPDVELFLFHAHGAWRVGLKCHAEQRRTAILPGGDGGSAAAAARKRADIAGVTWARSDGVAAGDLPQVHQDPRDLAADSLSNPCC